MIKVLIVDDHNILIDGIKALLSGSTDIQIVGECSDGSEVVNTIKGLEVDVILMDINMPNMNGIEATKAVLKQSPNVRILTMSMHDEISYIEGMLDAGASGYVLKNIDRKKLSIAIKTIYAGKNYFAKEITDILINHHYKKEKKDSNVIETKRILDTLTQREIEILKMIADEMTNVEIADELFLSSRTIDGHRRNLIQKTGVRNSIGLIKFAYSAGIIK